MIASSFPWHSPRKPKARSENVFFQTSFKVIWQVGLDRLSLQASLVAFSWWRIHLQHRRPWFGSWVKKIRWRRDRLPTPVFLGFPCGSVGKESACNAGDTGLIPGLGRSTGEGKGYPLQYSGVENSMDCIVHGVTKSQTWLSNFCFHFSGTWELVMLRASCDLQSAWKGPRKGDSSMTQDAGSALGKKRLLRGSEKL